MMMMRALLFGLMSNECFSLSVKGELVKHWQLSPRVASSLRCTSEGAERTGRTKLCLQPQKTTRHPEGCGLNPRRPSHTDTLRGYRWSYTKEKQIMRLQEVLQPQSGLSADQSAVGKREKRLKGRDNGWEGEKIKLRLSLGRQKWNGKVGARVVYSLGKMYDHKCHKNTTTEWNLIWQFPL